eukprot:TRINITY_DN36807_c0_g1_i1.p1 TRINITY_DN36807_c0_g1~~TRINITY_DN36807_c0_g1_i1.p1  ORF type:complete len:163 (+),score=6.15 TRINITY_DN36807_c0_g1_i1:777-1265(+)
MWVPPYAPTFSIRASKLHMFGNMAARVSHHCTSRKLASVSDFMIGCESHIDLPTPSSSKYPLANRQSSCSVHSVNLKDPTGRLFTLVVPLLPVTMFSTGIGCPNVFWHGKPLELGPQIISRKVVSWISTGQWHAMAMQAETQRNYASVDKPCVESINRMWPG